MRPIVMFIHGDDYYNKDLRLGELSQDHLWLNNGGPIGTVSLAWLPEYTEFANLDIKTKTQKE